MDVWKAVITDEGIVVYQLIDTVNPFLKSYVNKYFKTNYSIGDVLKHTAYKWDEFTVEKCAVNTRDVEYHYISNRRYAVYVQQITSVSYYGVRKQNLRRYKLVRRGINFSEIIKEDNKMPAIEESRPTLVREYVETTEVTGTTAGDTKITRTYIGDYYQFDRVSDAQAWVKNEIVNTIRSKNEYRTFAIFTQHSVGKASEPPVTFE